MPSRYIAVGDDQPPADVHGVPDYAAHGWQFAAYSDLFPGPVAEVAVAVTEEAGRQQTDVMLRFDASNGSSVRERSWGHRMDWSKDEELPDVLPVEVDNEGLDALRISVYGEWGRRGLASALREAAEMLEAAERHLPGQNGTA